jgi:hypothetical protein
LIISFSNNMADAVGMEDTAADKQSAVLLVFRKGFAVLPG